MTHPFPVYVLRQSGRLRLVETGAVALDWPARLGIGLTLAKIPLTVFLVFLIFSHALQALNVTVCLTVLLDIADGEIFNRSAHAGNRFLRESRRIWDGTLDRMVIWTTLTFAVLVLGFPLVLFSILMLREFAVCAVTSYPYFKSGFVHAPNLPSKLGAVLIGAQLVLFTVLGRVPLLSTFLCIALSIVGLWLYVTKPERI